MLVAAGRDCGMDAVEVRRRLASDMDVEAVSAEAESAKAAGIDGVPCFILGGMFAVSGAQAPEYLADPSAAPPPNAPNPSWPKSCLLERSVAVPNPPADCERSGLEALWSEFWQRLG